MHSYVGDKLKELIFMYAKQNQYIHIKSVAGPVLYFYDPIYQQCLEVDTREPDIIFRLSNQVHFYSNL